MIRALTRTTVEENQSDEQGHFHQRRTRTAPEEYVVTSAILFAAIGFVSGVIGLVVSFRGRHVFFVLGPFHLEGVPAGILGVPLMPLVFAVAGILLALITYLPASWILRRV